MNNLRTVIFLSSIWLTACGGGSEVSALSSADPATQMALSAIAERARLEAQEPSTGDAAVAGVQRNAQVLARTVLANP